ncbi:MAG: hypothetical protein KF713_19435 [Turneriella sp.]|nr:hypothetical protein [Turneriella sp.]
MAPARILAQQPAPQQIGFASTLAPQAGNPFILMGAGSSVAKIFVESTSGVATPTPPGNAITNGSVSFRVNSGLYANQYIIAHGGGTTSNAFDQNSTMSTGPVFPNSLGAGAQAFTLTTGPRSGQTVILTGGTTGFAYYNHSLNSFTNLNSLTANVGTDSSVTKITAGTDTGKFFLVNGFASRNTSMLDPAQDNFVGTRLFRTSGGALTAFVLKTGSYAGRTMIVTSGTTPSLYDPSTGTVSPGPLMPGGIAAGTSTMLMTGPINTGKHYIFQGGSSAIYMYDPVAHAFANATQGVDFFVAPTLKGSGSRIFTVPTGPQANNYVILNGGASNQADVFNTTTNTFTTGIAVNGCASINAGSQVFSISTGTHTGKYMIICGGSTTTSVF